MIEAHELNKRYGGKTAVHELSFTVRPGQVTGRPGRRGHRAGALAGGGPAARRPGRRHRHGHRHRGGLLRVTGLPAERIGDLALRHGIAVHPRLLDRFARHLPGSGAAGSAVHEQLAQLTEREREVLAEVARGLSKLEIGQRLAVSEATVKSHVGRILTELALRDRVQVVVYADENGIIRPGD